VSDPADIRYQTLAERAEAANELASMLSVQLRDVMRERDALRAWVDAMPRTSSAEAMAAWLQRCPAHAQDRPSHERYGG